MPNDPLDQMRQDNRSIESEARQRSWQDGRRVDQFGFVDRRTLAEPKPVKPESEDGK